MRNPMRLLRQLIKQRYPDQEIDEDAYQRMVDYCEQPVFVPTDSDEPRCDITGQPLTIQQQFNQECG